MMKCSEGETGMSSEDDEAGGCGKKERLERQRLLDGWIATTPRSEEEKARSCAMHSILTEEHNSPHKAWCCVKNVALRRGPGLDSETVIGQLLEKGTHVEARHSPNCPST